MFTLRFDEEEIEYWAARYAIQGDALVEDEIGPKMREAGYLSKPDFLKLCYWKSPRSQSRCDRNSEEMIREVTRVAFSTPSEQLRIEVLTLLSGVSWPTASVILHFGHRDPYPVLDYRALWSLCTDVPMYYDFPFWQAYTKCCRGLAEDAGVSMRTLDRGLWQYAKEHQS